VSAQLLAVEEVSWIEKKLWPDIALYEGKEKLDTDT
jgi:hypothetical protein